MNTGVVIAAGGIGKRMGADKPKQLLEILGKPIICHTFDRFLEANIADLVVVVPSDSIDEMQRLLKKYPSSWKVTTGGERRQDSVMNGLDELENIDAVLIHDAARPFIRPELIKKCIQALENNEAVLVALKARDTIKEGVGDFVDKTIPRENIWQAQTPQGAKINLLREALEKASNVTDDSMALENIGIKPVLIEGDPWNIKITTKEDMVIAEAIARRIAEDENWHRV